MNEHKHGQAMNEEDLKQQQQEAVQEEVNREDDGSLAFLKIPRDTTSTSYNCPTTTQGNLVNTQFWVRGFHENIATKFSKAKGSEGQCLVLVSRERDAKESECRKFFTGSKEILYILREIRKLDKFPRLVTLRGNGNRYWFE